MVVLGLLFLPRRNYEPYSEKGFVRISSARTSRFTKLLKHLLIFFVTLCLLKGTVMYHLHLGLIEEDHDAFRRAMESRHLTMYVDGDGWEVWGEKPEINGNSGPLRHVIVEVANHNQGKAIAAYAQKHFVGNAGPYYSAQISSTAVLSDSEVWSTLDDTEAALVIQL